MKPFVTILAVAVIAGSMIACSWLGLGVGVNGKCDKQTLAQVDSPGGKWKAATVRQTCEARDVRWSLIEVEVREREKDAGTSVFTASNGALTRRMPESAEVRVEWKSDSELWILYPPGYHTTCTSTDAVGIAVHCADASIVR